MPDNPHPNRLKGAGMPSIEKIGNITIQELIEMKKIFSLSVTKAVPEMMKIMRKYGLTDVEAKNLLRIARDIDISDKFSS